MTRHIMPRAMQSTLRHSFEIFPIVTVCGPRQSGKTTLCRAEFPDLPYLNLEDLTTRQFAIDDPKGFLAQFGDGAIIDEAQLVPELFGQIQALIDEDIFLGKSDRKFILTGSSNFAMLPNLRQSLAGRTAILTLLPMSTCEIASAHIATGTAEEMIIAGGYPAVWTHAPEQRRAIIENYINTYVERDVRRLMEVKDLNKFATFLRLCAARIGSELNKSSLAVEAGVSVPTIDSWISVLEASYVVFLLRPWHSNIGKRLVKSHKLYFTDTAIACSLLGIHSAEQLIGHPLRGQLFENLVVGNAEKYNLNRGMNQSLYFYRDRSGREIDLLREDAGRVQAFEIKAGMTIRPEYFRHLDYFRSLAGDKLEATAVVYGGDVEMPKAENGVINYLRFPNNFKVEL